MAAERSGIAATAMLRWLPTQPVHPKDRRMTAALRDAAKEYLVRYGGDVFPNLIVEARGTVVRDDTGREILDFTSGQMCATIGHNHPAIVAAVNAAGEKAFHLFSGMIPEVVAELGQTLARDWMPRRPVQVAVRQHRRREQRGRAAHGQAAHRRLRGARRRRLLARRDRGHQRRFVRQRPQGLRRAHARRVRDARAERLPALYRRRIRGSLGAGVPRTWPQDVRHAIIRPPRRDHHRADHQRRRRAGAAPAPTCRRCARPRTSAACC